MKHPVVVVTVETGGHRWSSEARIYAIDLNCGCWGHAFHGGRLAEMAISPSGIPLGMRTRTDQPFKLYVKAGPVELQVEMDDSLVQQELRDHADDIVKLEKIKQRKLDLQEQQEEKTRKRK